MTKGQSIMTTFSASGIRAALDLGTLSLEQLHRLQDSCARSIAYRVAADEPALPDDVSVYREVSIEIEARVRELHGWVDQLRDEELRERNDTVTDRPQL